MLLSVFTDLLSGSYTVGKDELWGLLGLVLVGCYPRGSFANFAARNDTEKI